MKHKDAILIVALSGVFITSTAATPPASQFSGRAEVIDLQAVTSSTSAKGTHTICISANGSEGVETDDPEEDIRMVGQGGDRAKGYSPVYGSYAHSETVALYPADMLDIQPGEAISSIYFPGYIGSGSDIDGSESTFKVGYAWDDRTTLEAPESAYTDFDLSNITMVFDGTVKWEAKGSSSEYVPVVVVNFDKPIVYPEGKSLLLYFYNERPEKKTGIYFDYSSKNPKYAWSRAGNNPNEYTNNKNYANKETDEYLWEGFNVNPFYMVIGEAGTPDDPDDPGLSDQPIMEEPAGTVQWYSCESHAYYPDLNWGIQNHQNVDGVARKVVFSEDGKNVWFRNPISHFVYGSWAKADIEGETITLPMGQVIAVTETKPDADGNTEKLVWTLGVQTSEQVYDEDWGEWKTVWSNSDAKSIEFSYKDGIISQIDKDIMLALVCEGEFMTYGDVDITMYPINPEKEITRFPENGDVDNWTLSYGFTNKEGHVIETCTIDDTVYIRGLWAESPSATIKGEIKDGKLTIPSCQYLGYTTQEGVDYFVYFMSCVDGPAGMIALYQPTSEPFVFNINEETGNISQSEDNSYDIIIKGGYSTRQEISKTIAFLVLNNPEFKIMSTEVGTPQAPGLDKTYCYKYYPGVTVPFSSLEFTLRPFDENGTALKSADLRYVIWVDNERIEFKSGEFPNWENIPEPMIEIPLDFKNGWGIEIDGTYVRRVQVPFADPEKIGAQMIYIDPKTQEHKGSQIAYYYPDTKEIKYEDEPPTTSINYINDATIENVEYFDLLGNRVRPDYKGVCIKLVRFSNGTVKSNKVFH